MSATPVSSDTLLRGAWYALEHAGQLVHEANGLLTMKRFGTASALAIYAMEEIGRHHILLRLWEQSAGSSPVTAEDVQRACGSQMRGGHEHRQRRARTAVRASPQLNALGDAAVNAIRNHPRQHQDEPLHPERQRANQAIAWYIKGARTRSPGERHGARQRGLYVDLDRTGTGWNRPNDMSPEEASRWLSEGIYEYLGTSAALQNTPLVEELHPALAAALDQWPDRPPLPPPPLPPGG